MRKLLNWLVVGAILWSGYWGIAAWALHQGVSAWFIERTRQGWLAEHDGLASSGYPLHQKLELTTPVLADPGTGIAWRADWLSLNSASLSPLQQRLQFPSTAQRISYFDRTLVLTASDMQAALDLAPGQALALDDLNLQTGTWRVNEAGLDLATAQSAELRMTQTEAPETYTLTLALPDLSLPALQRSYLRGNEGLPDRFDAFELKATVQFDTAWDRRALELHRPQPRRVGLDSVRAQWGPMHLRATGSLTVDTGGIPTGEITIQAQDWQQILSLAEHSGLLAAQMRGTLEQVLALLAGRGGHPDRLEMRLSFVKGTMMLGPLPLGPAPRFIIR